MKKNINKKECNESKHGYDFKVTNIAWDVDDVEDFDDDVNANHLPESIIVTVPEEICAVEEEEEWISDYLSDIYGFCHNGFFYEPVGQFDESMDIRKHRFVPKMDTSTKAMKSMKDKERERERRNWNQRLRNGDYDDFDYDDYEEYDESKNLSDRDLSDLVYSILVDEDYSADAMVSEIGELVDADSTGLGAEIYDILTDDELSSEGMVSELEGLVKRVDESHSKDWLGIKGATYIYHGDWADPEIQYDGMSLNYYDVEDGLLAEYREENPDDKNDIGFDDWMAKPSTKSLIQSALDDLVQGGCGTPLDEYDRDEDVIGDYMVEDSSDKARKLGFMGDEKDSDKWLNDKYGQHLNEVYDKIESIVGSEDAEAVYEYWKRIKSQFNCRWGGKTEYEHLDELKKILGQEGKELTDEIEAKWKSDAKSLSDYYSTSHLRGGFTGD